VSDKPEINPTVVKTAIKPREKRTITTQKPKAKKQTKIPVDEAIDKWKVIRDDRKISMSFKAAEKYELDESLIDEILETQEDCTDTFRKLPTNFVRVKSELQKIDQAMQKMMAFRSRMVEISTTVSSIQQGLERLWLSCESHILERYIGKLAAYKVDEKKVLLREILSPLDHKISMCKVVADAATAAVKHIDNIYFSIKEIKKSWTLILEYKRMRPE